MAKTMFVWTCMHDIYNIAHGLDDTERYMKKRNVRVIESCKQKKENRQYDGQKIENRQYDGQKKQKRNKTQNGRQNTTQKTKT